MSRNTCLVGITAFLAMLLCACGSTQPMRVEITTPPPSTMEISASAPIVARVNNDPSNAGIDWTCTPAASCGTFSPTHTASGASTTYQAPNSTGSVTIIASATKNPAINRSVAVTIGPIGSVSSLKGTYTYYATGWDTSSYPYTVVGSVTLDGNGNVTGGEQDLFDLSLTPSVDTADPINKTGGSITLGMDGRGTLTFTLGTLKRTETFSVVLINNDHLRITEFDSTNTSAGAMNLQTSPASVPAGGNAFAFIDPWYEAVLGGVATSDGKSAFTAGRYDLDTPTTIPTVPLINQPLATGSFTAPDAAGRGTITLTSTQFTYQFAYYVVGPEVFRLIETDALGYYSGPMYGQGTAAGAFSAGSLKGNFAFGQNGYAFSSSASPQYGAAGEFTTDGSASLTAGTADLNEGDGNPIAAASLAGSSYAVASDGYGSITLATALDGNFQHLGVYLVDPSLNVTDPNNTSGGGGALMLDLDTYNMGTGLVAPQSTGATFAGNYGFYQDGTFQAATAPFFDLIGQVLSDGLSTLTGHADYNLIEPSGGGQYPNQAISATFTPDAAHAGRLTAKLSITGSGSTTNENISLYQASDNLLFHVDMDSTAAMTGNTAVGLFEKQQ